MQKDTPDLEAAYGLETPDDNKRLYAQWAQDYDSGFALDSRYVLPLRVAEAFAHTGAKGPVIDLGAGTGLCGEALSKLGVGPVDATDLSPEMLEVAAQKGVYRRLFAGNMLDRLPAEDATYAGAVSSGTFTHGHVGPAALSEIVRLLAPGGVAVLSVNAAHYEAMGFAAAFARLAQDEICEVGTCDQRIYAEGAAGEHADDLARLVTFRKRP